MSYSRCLAGKVTHPVTIRADGKLYADTSREALASLPENRWIHVEVAADNRSEAGARWQLVVTWPGEAPKTFALLLKDGNRYRETTWVGFFSDGDRKSEWWLDNLEILNSNAP